MALNVVVAAAGSIVVVNTVADRILDRPLSEIGGKGLFTKELEQALFAGEVDVAVLGRPDGSRVVAPLLDVTARRSGEGWTLTSRP